MIISLFVVLGLLFSIVAVMRPGVLLPALIIYAFLPIRVWTELSVPVPGIGSLVLDTLLALLFSLLITVRLFISNGVREEKLDVLWALWLFLGLASVSSFLMGVMGQSSGFKMLVRFIYPILIFMLVLKDHRGLYSAKKIIKFFIWAGVIASVGVLIANIIGISSWRWSAGVTRFSGLGSISDYAYLMGLLAILSYVVMKHDRRKLVYGIIAAIFIAQMMMTVTRGAIFATAIAFIAIEMFAGSRKLSVKLVMPVVLLSILLSAVVFYEPLRSRVFGTHYSDVSSNENASLSDKFSQSFTKSGREGLWTYVSKKVFTNYHVLFGYGIGSAEVDIVSDLGGVTHNEYVRIVYEMGVVGLLLFMMALYQLWKIPLKLVAKSNDSSTALVAASCLGVFVLYVSGALVDNMINKYKNMGAPMLMFIAFAYIYITSNRGHKARTDIKDVVSEDKEKELGFESVKLRH